MAEYIDKEKLLQKLSRMIEYCENDNLLPALRRENGRKGEQSMKITLEISDNMRAATFNGVEGTSAYNLTLVSYSLDIGDLKDGNTIKLPRDDIE